jgi:peptide/nickel transport system permease protein
VRTYILRRLLAMLATLVGVSVIVFVMMRLIPGTVVEQLLGQSALVGEETIRSLRQFFGLDRPWYVQYVDWMGGLLRGDLGTSWRSNRPVLALIFSRLPVSGELALLSIAWSLLIGIPMGVLAALRRGQPSDSVIRFASTLGLSVPAFWQGTLLILLFSIYLQWMPSIQWVSIRQNVWANLSIIALPALTLGTATAAMISRMTRSTMLDVLGREYVRTARAKGVGEPRVVSRHALRNALIPVVTVAGVQMGYILGGIVVVEDVFSLPGIGRLLLDAIFQRDYPVVQGTILVGAALFMGLNFLVDLLYAVIDPRIQYA